MAGAGFLSARARHDVTDKLEKFAMHQIDLSNGAVLERGCVYIVKLQDRLPSRRSVGNGQS